MKKAPSSRFDKLMNGLLFLDLLVYAAFLIYFILCGMENLTAFFLLLAAAYPLGLILWVLSLVHALTIFFRRDADGFDIFLGISEVVLTLALTPGVFTLWRTLLSDPGLVFSYFNQEFFFRSWMLARLLTIYLLFLRGIVGRFLRPEAVEPLKVEDLSMEMRRVGREDPLASMVQMTEETGSHIDPQEKPKD